MTFKKNILLKSNYSVNILFEKLEKTMEFDIKNPTKRKFRGKVDRESNTFLISQSMQGFESDGMRPKISGVFKPDSEQKFTTIKLSFTLPKSMIYLIITILILNTIFLIALLFIDGLIAPSFKETFIYIAPIGFAVFVIFANYSFKLKTSEAINDLSLLFGAKEI